MRINAAISCNRSDCWPWQGSLNNCGYAYASHEGKLHAVHRFMYELFIEEIPAGLQLDHLCKVKHCINPWHLEPVTQTENLMRGMGSDEDHCKNGHAFTEDNTYVYTHGGYVHRACKTCKTLLMRKYRAEKGGGPND